jgi:hypothetical protein
MPELASKITQGQLNYLIIEVCITGAFSKYAWSTIKRLREELGASLQQKIENAANAASTEDLLKSEFVETSTREALITMIHESIALYEIRKNDETMMKMVDKARKNGELREDFNIIDAAAPYFSETEFDFLLGFLKLKVVNQEIETDQDASDAYHSALMLIMAHRYELSQEKKTEKFDELSDYITNIATNTVIHRNQMPDDLKGAKHG